MAERVETTDAPPPPPPPPPPDTESRERAPEVAPELSDALTRDDQGTDAREPGPVPKETADQNRQAEPLVSSSADAPAGPAVPDARQPAPDQDGSQSEPRTPDLPRADVSPELRSAMAEPDAQLPGPSGDSPDSAVTTASELDDKTGNAMPEASDPGEPSAADTGTDPAVDEGADPVGTGTDPVIDEGTDATVDDGAGTDHSSSGSDEAAVTDRPDWPDPDSIRITPERAQHILDRHRAGADVQDKTEFPADWSDDKILGNVEDVARNPDVRPDEPQPHGTWLYKGTRDGVHISAVVNPDGTVRTAYPRPGDPGVTKNPAR
jgi:hypothetical protein